MALPLGAATYTYLFACSLDEALERLARLGFHACELTLTQPHAAPRDLDRAARQRLARHCATLGIRPVALQPTFNESLNLASLNAGIRQESARQIRECIELASDLETPIVVVVPGRVNALIPPPFELSLDLAVESLEPCLPLAERLGVTMALECTPVSFAPDAARMLRLVTRLNHPNVKVTLDVANNFALESPVEALHMVAPLLALVHLSDTRRSQWLHAAVGDGEVDFAAVGTTLQALGYEGMSVLETVVQDDPDEALRRSRAALERLGWAA